MKTKEWTDAEIISHIQKGGYARDQALYHISDPSGWNNSIISYVLKNSGTKEDGEDLAQETLIFFDRNIRLKKFNGNGSLKTYFNAIAKFQWYKKLRSKKPVDELQDFHYDESIDNLEDLYIDEERKKFIDLLLSEIGERCKKILRLWQLDYSMEEIAQQVNINSAALAKKEAYRCRERVRKFLEKNPVWKDLIY